jgi:hypothetical protein
VTLDEIVERAMISASRAKQKLFVRAVFQPVVRSGLLGISAGPSENPVKNLRIELENRSQSASGFDLHSFLC